jgi:large conductance mechanosensitive channel
MKEFKKLISRRNEIDIAVGLILATYFVAITKSLVNDVIMPPVGILLGGVDFADLKFVIKEAQEEVAEVAINYRIFINTIITFFIVSFAIFIVVKIQQSQGKSRKKRKGCRRSNPNFQRAGVSN